MPFPAFPPVCELCVRHTPKMRVLGDRAGTRGARRLSTVCRAWGAAGATGKGPGGEGKREGLSSPGERAEGGQKGTVSLEEALLCMILC